MAYARQELVSMVLSGCQDPGAVRLWKGELAAGPAAASCIVYFRQAAVPRELVRCRDLLRLALRLPARDWQSSTYPQRRSGRGRANTPASIAHHNDVGKSFHALWLNPGMVYSCANFSDMRQSLAAAQRDKLDYLCRKLRLYPGQTLLDIGCGWGALAL